MGGRAMNLSDISQVAERFRFAGKLESASELTAGLINNSYRLNFRLPGGEARAYVLQQINTYVFKRPEEVMSNVRRITEHLRGKLLAAGEDPARRALHLIETVDGGIMYRDAQDRCWRAYDFIRGAVAYDRAETPEHFRQAGAAFGEFQRMLLDFPAGELYETIPGFHDSKRRFETFLASVEADRAGRARGVQREIDFLCARRGMLSRIVDMLDNGELPLRVTHNDTKMNNVMLDAETGRGLCVIDLDTVMPGSALYDYGDALRFGASTAPEDEENLDKISLDMGLFRAFTDGFVNETRAALTPAELRLLPLGIEVLTGELAMRFLTDYLDGDLYFKTAKPEHNLIRARAQMRLLEDVEEKYDALCAHVAALA